MTHSRDNRTAPRLAWLATAVVAVAFAVVVGVLMLDAAKRADVFDMLNAPQLERLRAELRDSPDNAGLLQKIRELDYDIRLNYALRQNTVTSGAWLLLAGIAAALFSFYRAGSFKTLASLIRRPGRDGHAEDADVRRRRAVAAAVAVTVTLVFFAVAARLRLAPLPPPPAETPVTGREGVQSAPDDAEFMDNWHQFRGPAATNVVAHGVYTFEWDTAPGGNVLWKIALELPGHSSPVCWDERVFVTGAKGRTQKIFAYDAAAGRKIWESEIAVRRNWQPESPGGDPLDVFEETGLAAPSPVTDGRFVVATFATGDIACVAAADGKLVWGFNAGKPDSVYGLSSSLAIYRNLVIWQLDMGGSTDGLSNIAAFEIDCGEVRWRTARPVPNSWASPAIIRTDGRTELLTAADPWVIAYEPATGHELWRAGGLGGDVAPSVTYSHGVFFALNENSNLLAIRSGGSGDVTASHVVWRSDHALSDMASPVADEKRVWSFGGDGRIVCYDAGTGDVLYEHWHRAGFRATPAIYRDTLLAVDENGVALTIRRADTFEVVGRSAIGEGVWASPAFHRNVVYVRGLRHLFAVGKR